MSIKSHYNSVKRREGTPWPVHADGTPKTMGEMTPAERHEQTRLAVARFQKELDAMRPELERLMNDEGQS